ncbi:MAG TPA: PH domain-containing protein [Kouleothrix sp.]|uniref:PH domain-containing protein n=1 Tax=Kouleothrix sp. TaxID=2779161 RepID=UPI002B65B31E|nr:PH domain-containing protein [Kouleothrix sp.]HRC76684.1 PH domain-containing protein [Kouleothrix sp.]
MLGFLKPNVDLELDEGEQILHYTRRHWILLLQRIFIPLLIAALTFGLALYRLVGGQFFQRDVAPTGRLVDVINIFFLALIGGLLFVWFRGNSDPKKKKKPGRFGISADTLLLLAMATLALMIYFRYQGGRVFYIDQASAAGADLINLLLFLVALVAFGTLVYLTIDWANDFLILTNTRVIYDDTQLLVRHVKQEILLENIQQVNLSADSYFAYFLGQLALWRDQLRFRLGLLKTKPPEKPAVAYGKLVVGSLSVRKLLFEWAANPALMQQKISAELGKLRKQNEPELLRQIIEDQVYGKKPDKKREAPIHVEERPGPIPWLFSTNPEINYEKEEVTWRPFWIFLVLAMLRPFGILLLSSVLLIIASRLELIGGGWALLIWLPIALGCIGRIIWVREEHEHDKYILQRDKIVDVDKRPFGPESTRSAPLDRIQDVSFDVSFVESILGYGDVFIETGGGGGKFTFKHVPDPRNVATTINDYLTDFKKREKERTQKDVLTLLKEYHTVQERRGELADTSRVEALLAEKLAEYTQKELPVQVEREVNTRMPTLMRRQMQALLRRNARRERLMRRRSES